MCREVPCDRCKTLAQFHAIAPVASVPKTAEPLETMGLTDDRAGPHHLPAFAPGVARSTDLIQPAKGWRQVFGLGQGALAGGLPRPIEIKDHPRISRSIQQTAGLLVIRVVQERATEHIIEIERAQGFDGCLGERREIA
jgi:hypothetical protein